MSNRPQGCKAYERGDQWFCDRCATVWDMNDDDPPECKPVWIGVDMAAPQKDKTMVMTKEVARNAVNNMRKLFK